MHDWHGYHDTVALRAQRKKQLKVLCIYALLSLLVCIGVFFGFKGSDILLGQEVTDNTYLRMYHAVQQNDAIEIKNMVRERMQDDVLTLKEYKEVQKVINNLSTIEGTGKKMLKGAL